MHSSRLHPLFDRLSAETAGLQAELLSIPFARAAMAGELDRRQYLDFLEQAYHHVKHTVPLLMATGAALGATRPELQRALCHYIEEEAGHEQWILDDIRAAGGDAEAVRSGQPGPACELLVAYAYDLIQRRNPIGFFGMVHVLEGTSVRAATRAAEALAPRLGLPPSAFRYLSSHGSLDLEHVDFFAGVLRLVTDPAEQDLVVHCARMFFRLYGNVLRGLSPTAVLEPSPC